PRPPAGKAPVAKEPAKPPAPPTVRTLLIETIDLVGPPGQAPSAAQRRLFTAVPGKDLAKREAARRIATDFARRAYRRPATAAEIDVLLSVFDLADGQDEVFSEAVKLMLKGALVSPQFLFITGDSGGDDPAGVAPLGDHELAARLSYFLWSTMPDDELAALADAGTLHEPARLAQQVRRLIADPRSVAFFDSFAAPWLGLDRLDALPVDEQRFPQLTPALRRAMYDEAAQFFGAVLREDRSLLELIDADFTYLNAPLAKLYGLEGEVKGPQLRRVALTDVNRGGLLTMPGVLAVTSLPNRTSPVKRGRWVLEQILGQPAPQPPMNVAALEQQDTPANAGLNLRGRTELHRRDPACAGCHRVLDPLGFGLENFDPLGRWRERDDTGLAVDATGELPGSGAFHSPHELKRALAARRDQICRALAGRLLAHALCRSLTGYDEIVADDLAAAIAADGCKLQSLVVAVATSYPFLNRRTER
ncbi:MAG: DUF1592 domain-containing protein, partial [Planctomycetes bacterium]|nr:DUF1592 domain-containing protein [Planctomycetota bacterium]